MPFNNYAPQYIFKGQVQSDTAPSANNDLVRKQDVSGLSFISSIASGSSNYLSVSNGELSVSSLLISDVHVDGTQTSLANFISNEGSTAGSLKKGDILVLTNATGGAETYIVSGADGSTANNYTQIESGLTSAEIVAKLTGGTGINIASNGTISFNGDTDVVSEGSTNLYYTDARFNTAFGGKSTSDLSEGSNLYFTNTRARGAVTAAAGGPLAYANGIFSVSISNSGALDSGTSLGVRVDDTTIGITAGNRLEFKGDSDNVSEGSSNLYFTDARARAAFSAGTGITISGAGEIASSITQYTDANAIAAFSGGKGINLDNAGELTVDFSEFSTSDITEGTKLFYTDARARAALSAGTGITYNSSTGQIGCSITQYTDSNARAAISATGNISYNSSTGVISTSLTQYADANARAAVSAGNGLDYNSSTGEFSLDLKANSGLAIDSTELKVTLGEGLGFSPDGFIEVEAGSGLEINSGDQSLQVDKTYFRKVFSAQSFSANTAKTINHALGEKYVQVSVYDSSDNLVHAEVSLTDANNLTVTTSDALTGVTVVVSI